MDALVTWSPLRLKHYHFCTPCTADLIKAYETLRCARRNGENTARVKLARLLGGAPGGGKSL